MLKKKKKEKKLPISGEMPSINCVGMGSRRHMVDKYLN